MVAKAVFEPTDREKRSARLRRTAAAAKKRRAARVLAGQCINNPLHQKPTGKHVRCDACHEAHRLSR